MPTLQEITGAYIGYTETGPTENNSNYGFPTLYFENGRLTQRHKEAAVIGWHLYMEYRRSNIALENYNRYLLLREQHDEVGKQWFKAEFQDGELDDNAYDAKLFELIGNSAHLSRSRLMRYGTTDRDSLFNMAYGESYVRSVLRQYEASIRG